MERLELARLLGAPARLAEPGMAPTVVEEIDPARFMAAFAAATAEGGPVFIADPGWSAGERKGFSTLVKMPAAGQVGDQPLRGWLCVPSGGTSGVLKLVRHDEDTLTAAVNGFCAHFDVKRVNALGVLPLHHVSGLMAWMRCALTGGEYRPWDWKRLEAEERPALPAGDWFLSLVPTQLRRLLESPKAVAWLLGFRAIFIGGGPAWPQLTEAAAAERLPISLSYGMTETAAMVAALRPAEFLAGARSVGTPLPHARLRIETDGLLRVAGDSLFRGYWPETRNAAAWLTEDFGRFDERGYLQITGRRDAMILTGGKKVQPAEVEQALRATGEFADVAVIGVPSAEWGEEVVACYATTEHPPDFGKIKRVLERRLPAYQHPKRYLAIAAWPRTAQGKLNRAQLARLAPL